MSSLLVNGLIISSAYLLIAIGFALVYPTIRFFHFAHGAVYTFGSCFAYLFYTKLEYRDGLPFHIQKYIFVYKSI